MRFFAQNFVYSFFYGAASNAGTPVTDPSNNSSQWEVRGCL
jgi:hypothetical protein